MAGPRSLTTASFFVLAYVLAGLPTTAASRAEAAATAVSGTSVLVSADAFDNVGVMGVEFLLDGAPIAPQDSSAPYSTVWDTTSTPDGTHVLTARAWDAAGNETYSAPVDVLVDNGPAPDTTSPTVVTTAPQDGDVVSGVASLAAAATDDVGVVGVLFLVDGQPVGAEDATAPWSAFWDTTGVSNGAHTVAARARDAAGNTATSKAVAVTVDNDAPDQTPPQVATTSPAEGETVSGVVTVSASASDDVAVAGVQMLLDGLPLGAEMTSAPYTTTWDTTLVADGTHAISARARDLAGNEAVSPPITVTVTNVAPTDGSTSDGTSSSDQTGTSGDSTGSDPVASDALVEVSLTRDDQAETITIHSDSKLETVGQLDLFIDGAWASGQTGEVFDYVWDIHPLVGFHEVQIVGTDAAGTQVTSSSVYQIEVEPSALPGRRRGQTDSTISSNETGAMMLTVTGLGGGLFQIQGETSLSGVRGMELRVDDEVVASGKNGKTIEFQLDESAGGSHELSLVAYDRTGVLATTGLTHGRPADGP